QLPAFDRDREKFAALNAQVLDISVDTLYSDIAWQKYDIGTMHFPMCSDFYPHGAVAQAYGVLREGQVLPGISDRAVFVVDKSGKIVFSEVYPLDQVPDNEAILAALRKAEI
ncbi:MAG TPA: redoxin domain-containing protein, partial [Terriglobales bacterium]|nr:redoxin domain-containing protein [Terriglobales bacterium]